MIRVAALAFLLLPLASAHRPEPAGEYLVIDNPPVSHVIAGEFVTGDEVFTVALEYDEPFAMPMEMMVPWDKDKIDHRPVFAIVGPGLPEPSYEETLWLPKEVPEGYGVFIERNDDEEREIYFETVMRRTLMTSGSIAAHLAAPGLYEVWIWSPDFTVGEFWYGFGVEEDFSGDAWSPLFEEWDMFAW